MVSSTPTQLLLNDLLRQFELVFAEPQGLPPAHPYDHRIHLLPGAAPVAVRPYRYPQLQKDELERQCSAMLAQGIIRPSTSPFSAPVLLVRKPAIIVYFIRVVHVWIIYIIQNSYNCYVFIIVIPYDNDSESKLSTAIFPDFSRFQIYLVKLIRAQGGCLGTKSR